MAKKRRTKKAVLDLTYEETEAFLASLKTESDRGMVLISAALLDDTLEVCIRSLLIDHPLVDDLFNMNGAIGTLGARIRLAFGLGILSEAEYLDCVRIATVRNEFAHQVSCSFKDDRVKDICSNFSFNKKTGGGNAKRNFLGSSLALLALFSVRPAQLANHYRLKLITLPR